MHRNKKIKQKKNSIYAKLFLILSFFFLVGLGNYVAYENSREFYSDYQNIVEVNVIPDHKKPVQSAIEFRTTSTNVEWRYSDSDS